MNRLIRRISFVFAILAVLAAMVAGSAWWFFHTKWFAGLVRARIQAALQRDTGARVELGGFDFNPDTFETSLQHLVIHGTEPAGVAPLVEIDSIRVGLKLLTLWQRDQWQRNIDLQSVEITRPRIHILIDASGRANIPRPKRRSQGNAAQQLLDLKVKQFKVEDGSVTVNDQQIPFNFASNHLDVHLSYDVNGPSYSFALDTDHLMFSGRRMTVDNGAAMARGRLFENHLAIDHCEIQTGPSASKLAFAGSVTDFAHPSLDAVLQADLSMDELARIGKIEDQLRHGRITVEGNAHADLTASQFIFKGKARADSVDFSSPHFSLRKIRVNTDVLADNHGMSLQHVAGETQGARFDGNATVKSYKHLEAGGRVSNVALSEVGRYLTDQPFPWSGAAFGTAHAEANLGERDHHFFIAANVDIAAAPAQTGIPASGHVEVSYDDSKSLVEFGNSTLQLPNTAAAFSGVLETQLALRAQTTNLADIAALLPILGSHLKLADLPYLSRGGSASFDGSLQDVIAHTVVSGVLLLKRFKLHGSDFDSFSTQATVSASEVTATDFRLSQAGAAISGKASAQLSDWTLTNDSPLQASARFSNLNVVKTLSLVATPKMPVLQGVVSGNGDFQGTINHPRAAFQIQISNLDAYGEQVNQIRFDASLRGNSIAFEKGRVQAGPATLTFSGNYEHKPDDWSLGLVRLKADTNGFPMASLATVRSAVPRLDGRAEVHVSAEGNINQQSFQPLRIDGNAQLRRISIGTRPLGDMNLIAVTRGNGIQFSYFGDLKNTQFQGSAAAQLSPGTPLQGDLNLNRISLAALQSLATDEKLSLPIDGSLDGRITFAGSLEDPSRLRAKAIINTLQLNTSPKVAAALDASTESEITLHNSKPILLNYAEGVLHVAQFEIAGRDTTLAVTGDVPLLERKPINVTAVGKLDLALFSLFDENVHSSGNSELEAKITGSLQSPDIAGDLQIHKGSFFLSDFSNGLSNVEGLVQFTHNRATIQKMTANSGGGQIALGGTVNFGGGGPLVYHLDGDAHEVRVRYANSISVTSNASLRLNGTSATSILSGSLSITRVVFTPNADVGNLIAAASSYASTESDQTNFLTGLRLDIALESAPNLQVSTNLSRDVEAEIGLHLRGTPDHPIVLGSITANQGDIRIFGTRFSLNRGEVSFVNTIRIEPVLDLDLETQARGVTVDITVSGTPSKLNFNYRSDPPLQPRDIIALLTVGRAPDLGTTGNAQNGADVGVLTSGVNSVLGQAISPVSNRLSKLFGIANIKIDPFIQGITNTPQARLSVEQQVSANVTVTYVTNLSQTSEQIFRFEWALSRQFSVVAIRDDNGEFGIDFQYKKRFK